MIASPRILHPRRRRWHRRGGEHGTSLVETLIAAAVLLLVSIGLVPLFTRAMLNNRSGYDSNEASYQVRSALESEMALAIDDPRFDLEEPPPEGTVQVSSVGTGGEEMRYVDRYWDQGALASGAPGGTPKPFCNLIDGGNAKTLAGSTDCVKLGDGTWITDPTQARGQVLWQRRMVLRRYNYLDIGDPTSSASSPGEVVLDGGHPHLFDRPLLATDPNVAHLVEHTVELKSERGDASLVVPQLGETTQPLGPGSQRTRIFRLF